MASTGNYPHLSSPLYRLKLQNTYIARIKVSAINYRIQEGVGCCIIICTESEGEDNISSMIELYLKITALFSECVL